MIDWVASSCQESNDTTEMAYRKACKCKLRFQMQDLKLHFTRQKHIDNMKAVELAAVTRPIDSFFKPGPSKPNTKLKLAELCLAAHVAVHSSLCTVDHLTPVLASTFQYSSTAGGMTLGRTKCTALISKVLRPTFREMLLEYVGQQPYSLIVDGSADRSCTKELGIVFVLFLKDVTAF